MAHANHGSGGVRYNPLDFLIKLEFEKDLINLESINLNSKAKNTIHNVFEDKKREFYVLQNRTVSNKHILTVRTQYLLENKSKSRVSVKLFIRPINDKGPKMLMSKVL